MIDTFLARQAPCAVCGTVAWAAGDVLRASIIEEPIQAITGPQAVFQSFRCTHCDNVVFIFAFRTTGTKKGDS